MILNVSQLNANNAGLPSDRKVNLVDDDDIQL